MRIAVIGSGYVGLVSGTCFSEFGFDVTCVDRDKAKIASLNKGIIPIYEPGLEHLVQQGIKLNRLHFSTDIASLIPECDVVMLAVGTPTANDGSADLSYIFQALEDIAPHIMPFTVVVTKSTVPVGTCAELTKCLKSMRPDLKMGTDVDVASNPEFLREGSAIEDFKRPDRVVVGVQGEKAKEVLQKLYRPLFLIETPMVWTTPESAEIIKYAANGFLAMKIAYINEIADLCEQTGADAQEVAKGMGLDGRIGRKFLNVSPGYGGSCFPKDTLALRHTARSVNTPISIIEAVISSNEDRKKRMAQKIISNVPKNGTVAVLGLTFKPNTDDYREASSLVIIPELIKAGLNVRLYDPIYNKNNPVKDSVFEGVIWVDSAYDAIEGSNGVVLLTEWNEFRALDLDRVRELMILGQNNKPVIIDLRNIYKPNEMFDFCYISIGRAASV